MPDAKIIEDGGPAFPVPGPTELPSNGIITFADGGMSLRDWFAGRALAGMLAHSRNGHGYHPRDPSQHWHEAISAEAYEIADAMLAERANKEEG